MGVGGKAIEGALNARRWLEIGSDIRVLWCDDDRAVI